MATLTCPWWIRHCWA